MNCEVMLCPKHGFNPVACLESLCQWDMLRPCGEPAVAIVRSVETQIEYQSPRCRAHLPEKMQDFGNVLDEIKERL